MAQAREATAENRRAEERRERVLFLRLSDAELRSVKRAARILEVTPGEWGRALVVERAEKVIDGARTPNQRKAGK
jgi:hypothetical protein